MARLMTPIISLADRLALYDLAGRPEEIRALRPLIYELLPGAVQKFFELHAPVTGLAGLVQKHNSDLSHKAILSYCSRPRSMMPISKAPGVLLRRMTRPARVCVRTCSSAM